MPLFGLGVCQIMSPSFGAPIGGCHYLAAPILENLPIAVLGMGLT